MDHYNSVRVCIVCVARMVANVLSRQLFRSVNGHIQVSKAASMPSD